MRILNSVFKILSWAVIAAVVIFIMIAAPVVAGFRPVIVLSGSMIPSYPVGCITYYHSCDFSDLAVGDAVTYKAGDSFVTHRIVKVNGLSGTVVTKGDNNATEDSQPVEESQIAGKAVKFRIPWAGYFVSCGRRPVSIAIMVQIMLISYIIEKLYEKKKRSEGRK